MHDAAFARQRQATNGVLVLRIDAERRLEVADGGSEIVAARGDVGKAVITVGGARKLLNREVEDLLRLHEIIGFDEAVAQLYQRFVLSEIVSRWLRAFELEIALLAGFDIIGGDRISENVVQSLRRHLVVSAEIDGGE